MRGNEQDDKSDRRKPNEREIRHKGRHEKQIEDEWKNWIRQKITMWKKARLG
jgi:hypothetical protein